MYRSTTSLGGSTPFSTALALGFGVFEGRRPVVPPSAAGVVVVGTLRVSSVFSGFVTLLFAFVLLPLPLPLPLPLVLVLVLVLVLLAAATGASLLAPESAP